MRHMVQIDNRVGMVGFVCSVSTAVAISRALATHVGVGMLLPIVGIYLQAKIPASQQPDLSFSGSSAMLFSNFCQSEKNSRLFQQHIACAGLFWGSQVNL